jgi:methylglutaconyl-CoA hydratase
MIKYPNYKTIIIEKKKNVAVVTLNRPGVHNAFNNELLFDLYDVFDRLNSDDSIRVIVITGNGKSFCAGADLNWMKSVVNYSFEQNLEESLKLAELMFLIFTHTKPVIARINGSAIGGGVGLVSVCDILIAAETAKFGLSEVKLGLVPAAISPFVMERIGPTKSRELFVTGERISANKALEYGLINKVVSLSDLDEAVNEKINMILQNGPEAIKVVKKMIFDVTQMKFPELTDYTAHLIANLRLSKEAQEGMNAFLEKRKPNWVEKDNK